MKRYVIDHGAPIPDQEGKFVLYEDVERCLEELQIAIEGVLITYASKLAPNAIENLKEILTKQQEENKDL